MRLASISRIEEVMVAPAGEYFQNLAGHIATLEPNI